MRGKLELNGVGPTGASATLTSSSRIRVIAAVAAVSLLAVAPFTSAASARSNVKVGWINIECTGKTQEGNTAYFPEGTVVTIEDSRTGEKHSYECKNGKWFKLSQELAPTAPPIVEEPTAPKPPTNQERPPVPPVLAP